MKKALFTPEELEELRRVDEAIESNFNQTMDEIRESRQRDRQAKLEGMDGKKRKIAAQKAEYRKANREKYNAYQREYQRKKRAEKKSRSRLDQNRKRHAGVSPHS